MARMSGSQTRGRSAVGSCLVLAAAAVLLVSAREAAAATDCELSSGVLDVSMTATGDQASIRVAPGGTQIQVFDEGGAAVACTGPAPTVTNTNAISVHNAPGLGDNAVGVLEAGRFVPGLNTVGENGGTPEIEIFVNLNEGARGLSVTAPAAGGALVLGAGGLNPNATEDEVAPDADVFLNFSGELLGIELVGGPGPDRIDSTGGRGTGGPMPFGTVLQGGGGDDLLSGASARELLLGEAGDDVVDGGPGRNDALSGGGGDDLLLPGSAADPVDGGEGIDEVRYAANLAAGVALDLEGPTVAAERVVGTAFADVIRGDGGPNTLSGLGGNDVLEGRGGLDALGGGPGDDAIDARDGGADVVNCMAGLDTLVADPPGIDDVLGCESVLFPPAPATARDAVPPVPDTRGPSLSLRVRPRQGTSGVIRVRARSDEPCALALGGRVRPKGRRAGRLRPRRARLEASAPRALTLRPTRALARALRAARRGRARLVASCVDAAGNASRASARVRLGAR